MIEQDNPRVSPVDAVTLVLETKRFKVNRRKLIKKSRYFAILLSKTYKDYHLSEHIINYEISLTTFQDFINWLHRDKHMIEILRRGNIGRLLILLELGVLFVVDDLIENLTDIIEACYLLPENVLDIWLLAKELNINMLRDLSLAVCLDRFTELPMNLIYKLSRQDFLELVGNINIRDENVQETESDLLHIAQEWMKINQDTIPLDILKKTGPKVYPSIISCDNSDSSIINNKFYIHCWDEDKLFELTTFRYPTDIINNRNKLIGMQITARKHNLYLCGGEYGIGSGRFNTNVWRYSLMSKKWFLETVMPCARRHMIAAFVQNTLLLAGGVGLYRRKLKSLDIYNVHRGIWFKGMDVPIKFVTPPEYYVLDTKLIILYRIEFLYMCVYHSEWNEWQNVPLNYRSQIDVCKQYITTPMKFKSASCYIDNSENSDNSHNPDKPKKPDEINLRTIIVKCDNLEHNCKIFENITEALELNEINIYKMYLFFILSENDDIYENMLVCFNNQQCILIHLIEKEHLQWHSIPIRNINKFHSLSLNLYTVFCNLMDPANLYAKSTAKLDCIT